ncbi:SDR family NAD(P)-dependent oxidoreductase [Lysinibacillus antri]|uniref:SDR family NAD(P)-dependent oxidoreductase n=1 Tax=Lysinibacillus antri TaxID=2498145 RepID=A0A432LE18_9BACI|nr:SDR family NAD(P)-dependent oxidoreductase [Lysinibacillus antri]RUL55052.1 SDR family NAD(P)-dependent oxidoreductase [Lysinibacillus antri]
MKKRYPLRLQNKVVIITGSTSGIGEATAKLFAKEGAKVIVTGRHEEKGNEIVNEIIEQNGEAHFVQADITENDSYQKIVNETLSKYGQIDILVNNAGRIIEKPFLEFTESDWDYFINK